MSDVVEVDDAPADTPNRATIALVSEKVDGLKELTRAGFADLQRQVEKVADLPVVVAELRRDHESLKGAVSDLRAEMVRGMEWRRGPLLLFVGGLLAVVASLIVVLK